MTDDQRQKRYEECVQALQELADVMTLVVSTDAFAERSPLETLQECLNSMQSFDALPEEEKAEIQAQEEEFLRIIQNAVEPLEPVAQYEDEGDEDNFKFVSARTGGSKPSKKLLN
jgi:hypothetical protein